MKRLTLLCALLFSVNIFAQSLSIDNPYVRATPPHAKNSAAFLTLINNSDKTIKLVAASSDIAERVELHNHIHQDGMMKMRQVETISVLANSSTKLQPGSYHVMFLGLKQELNEGQVVNIKLYFDNGDEVSVKAPIKKINMQHNK
nr:hypothetical protein BCCFPMHH_00009 [uncultured bacterium]